METLKSEIGIQLLGSEEIRSFTLDFNEVGRALGLTS